jgi:RHS repeat-associated protein
VFKSFLDNTTLAQAQWYFYYDPMGRLVEVRYTPNAASSGTYSQFQLFWVGRRLVLYWQTDYPSVTTTRRYVGTDEAERALDMWTWPSSGNASRVWAVDPSAWGFDSNKVGPTVFQPIVFAGQYSDIETVALESNGTTVHRAGVVLNGFRTYDSFTGGYLQVDPVVPETRSSYGYVDSNPVCRSDPAGLEKDDGLGGFYRQTKCDFACPPEASCYCDEWINTGWVGWPNSGGMHDWVCKNLPDSCPDVPPEDDEGGDSHGWFHPTTQPKDPPGEGEGKQLPPSKLSPTDVVDTLDYDLCIPCGIAADKSNPPNVAAWVSFCSQIPYAIHPIQRGSCLAARWENSTVKKGWCYEYVCPDTPLAL